MLRKVSEKYRYMWNWLRWFLYGVSALLLPYRYLQWEACVRAKSAARCSARTGHSAECTPLSNDRCVSRGEKRHYITPPGQQEFSAREETTTHHNSALTNTIIHNIDEEADAPSSDERGSLSWMLFWYNQDWLSERILIWDVHQWQPLETITKKTEKRTYIAQKIAPLEKYCRAHTHAHAHSTHKHIHILQISR